jgi:hypothetical protein
MGMYLDIIEQSANRLKGWRNLLDEASYQIINLQAVSSKLAVA